MVTRNPIFGTRINALLNPSAPRTHQYQEDNQYADCDVIGNAHGIVPYNSHYIKVSESDCM
jgi:hypothetical protein